MLHHYEYILNFDICVCYRAKSQVSVIVPNFKLLLSFSLILGLEPELQVLDEVWGFILQ